MDFTQLFVDVDDFCQKFEHQFKKMSLPKAGSRRRKGQMALSEIMTLLIAFQTSGFRTFKDFYQYLHRHHAHDFPQLLSYPRLVEWIPRMVTPLTVYAIHCQGKVTGINFIDSTRIKVCNNKRIKNNLVFKGFSEIGRSTMGWFYGFKLHLVINDRGELLAFTITPGNVDDRKPVEQLTRNLWGKLFGDKGYISQKLFDQLLAKGLKLITSVRQKMKNKLLELEDKILLRKRSLIETVNDQLKNICQIEHTRHRSPQNFFVHLLCGLIAYSKQPKKPSLNLNKQELQALNAC